MIVVVVVAADAVVVVVVVVVVVAGWLVSIEHPRRQIASIRSTIILGRIR